jgi:hypothetical protein
MRIPLALALALACNGDDDAREAFEDAVRAPNAAALRTRLATLDDPVLHDAAVLTWVSGHRDTLSRDDARELCGRVLPQEQVTCRRRVEAAHLNR